MTYALGSVAILVMLSACSRPCDSTTCSGCCDANDLCEQSDDAHCGAGGAQCSSCDILASCVSGSCVKGSTSSSSGSTGGSSPGGSSGAATSSQDQLCGAQGDFSAACTPIPDPSAEKYLTTISWAYPGCSTVAQVCATLGLQPSSIFVWTSAESGFSEDFYSCVDGPLSNVLGMPVGHWAVEVSISDEAGNTVLDGINVIDVGVDGGVVSVPLLYAKGAPAVCGVGGEVVQGDGGSPGDGG